MSRLRLHDITLPSVLLELTDYLLHSVYAYACLMVVIRMSAWPLKMCRAVERTFLQRVCRQESTVFASGVRWSTNREFEQTPQATASWLSSLEYFSATFRMFC